MIHDLFLIAFCVGAASIFHWLRDTFNYQGTGTLAWKIFIQERLLGQFGVNLWTRGKYSRRGDVWHLADSLIAYSWIAASWSSCATLLNIQTLYPDYVSLGMLMVFLYLVVCRVVSEIFLFGILYHVIGVPEWHPDHWTPEKYFKETIFQPLQEVIKWLRAKLHKRS